MPAVDHYPAGPGSSAESSNAKNHPQQSRDNGKRIAAPAAATAAGRTAAATRRTARLAAAAALAAALLAAL